MIDETHDAARTSWIASAREHTAFPIQNLPFGIFSKGGNPRPGVAIGDFILDLAAAQVAGLLEGFDPNAFSGLHLNALLSWESGQRRPCGGDCRRCCPMNGIGHPSSRC